MDAAARAEAPGPVAGDLATPGYRGGAGRQQPPLPWDKPEAVPVGAWGPGSGSNGSGSPSGPRAGLANGPQAGLATGPQAGFGGGPRAGFASGPRAGLGGGAGAARIRIREAPQAAEQVEAEFGAAPVETEAAVRAAPRQPWYQVVTGPPARRVNGQIAPRTQQLTASQARQEQARQEQALQEQAQARGRAQGLPAQGRAHQAPAALRARMRLPFVAAHPAGHPPTADGRRNCGPLEKVLHRQWEDGASLPAQVVTAINRLAELPGHLQQKLADGLTGIFVGPGGVPDLDDMGALKGVPLPSGRATWDACAGAYGERKLVVGSRLSPTPDVMCHEVGHALDDLDAPQGKWQSDSPEFKTLYDQCKPHLVSDFHRQRGGLGRKEFFADAFAAVASAQRPALVDMLGGNTRAALWVMLYFNRRYGI